MEPKATDAPEHLRRLLALDPPSVLRCLRMLGTPCYGIREPMRSIDQIVRRLGHTVVQRTIASVAPQTGYPADLDPLWLHAVATAISARNLARDTGTMDPEMAYLAGLLHDFPLWTRMLQESQGTEPRTNPSELARHWNLDAELVTLLDELTLVDGDLSVNDTPATLIRAAELMAEIADFWHPNTNDEVARDLLMSTAGKRELFAARELRLEVRNALAHVGISATKVENLPAHLPAGIGSRLFKPNAVGSLGDVVLQMLKCTDSSTYRGVLTAATVAAIRYLGFDRAYYIVWQPATGHCVIRAKADLSPIRLRGERVMPSSHELAVLGESFRRDSARLLTGGDPSMRDGLLRRLGTDAVLLAPMNTEFMSPAFLVLDRQVSTGALDEETEAELVRSLAGMASLLIENQLLKRRRMRAQRFALVDSLTQLANRAVGIHTLTKEVFRAQRSNLPLTVMMLDMDDFKKLNDTYGHIRGDQALRAAADVLRRQLRRSDTICRYGGEEFLAVLPETSAEDASVLATRIFTAVAERGEELDLPLTVSIGLSELLDHSEPPESLLHRADRALYASKATGRNRFSVDARPQ